MNGISYNNYLRFNEKINKYLVFLVHVQQSEKLSAKDQNKIFDFAKDISKSIAVETKKYFSNLSEYNAAEKNDELKNKFNYIQTKIDDEIKRHKVIIDDNKLFHLENIIETLTMQNRNTYLTLMDLSNLFFFKEFDKNKRIDEESKKEFEELEKKQDMELETIKLKTFNDLLSSNNAENVNPGLFYKINKKILNETSIKDIITIEGCENRDKLPCGVFFIKNQKELTIVEKRDGVFIKYSINIIDMGKEFVMYIQGNIKIDEQEEQFKINEKYLNKNFEMVLNGYRLKKIYDIYNSLFIEKYRNTTDKKEENDKIDDYLSGRIAR